ncbi:MAG TPA: hypothetical protein PLZ57_04370 [Pseudobdellovibrionaceae bacterium]|mgnify:CR=1 FL=1|nr:hypothetical protein [Pseudobdellovibrionaceae bacterium]
MKQNSLLRQIRELIFDPRAKAEERNSAPTQRRAFTRILALGLLAGISGWFDAMTIAEAQNTSAPRTRTESIRALQVENLGAYQGKFLTVLYAIGSKPVLSTDNRQTELTEIRAVHTVPIQNGRATIPSVSLPIVGFRPAYNFVMFVVHEQRDFVWTNTTSVPRDPRGLVANDSNTLSLRVAALTKSQLERIAVEQPNAAALLLSF